MKIAIDSNVLITSLADEAHSLIAQRLLSDIARGRHKAIASSILYSEVLKAGQGSGLESDLVEYISLITNLSTVPADDEICIMAGELRLKYGAALKAPDALHLATALAARAQVFITNDKSLAKVAAKLLPTKELANWR